MNLHNMRMMKKKRMRKRNNMNIYIDIDRSTLRDKAIYYVGKVHWETDDIDTIDKKDLDELKRRIQYEVDRTLSNINTSRANPRTEY